MQLLPRLWATTLIVGCGVFAGSAHASLETGTNYSALPKDQIALNEYTGTVACQPVEPHYLPSFIRAADGTIIGVGYVEIENESGADC
ncbi:MULTISPECIES: hypothetical protein [Rhizobium]|jgi:hypothetical protein|uniref:Uncharacterized protein n=4 Tax=Rhizobium TaxID=379 RepID=A0A8G2MRV3_RHILV|nr:MULTISPECIES: hypothetical protein [Rhizobium]QJS26030.1 hypothetical protein RLTA1_01355 [Rhizobium leguminosarum bv. trifolii TA1]ACS54572.1 conserved hypothetical protein [Rhizobium leguminosarum bv. trifolii WSM1325]MBY2908833.1 hypothetical protein [Rhizobium leguminosarum]MBY2914612.1 hypothetical protein [Rhizobium leguminosarum]MBY2921006.1 hypothetical protein [Rhizobium leguminosarum]